MNTLISDFHSARETVQALEQKISSAKASFYRFLQTNNPAGRVNYEIFGWSDSAKPFTQRYTPPAEEFSMDLSLSTETEIAFTALDEDNQLFFMLPVEYLENTKWERKILLDMESDANLVRNELMELAGAEEAHKVNIFAEPYTVQDNHNPVFKDILRVSYNKKPLVRFSAGWLQELVTRYRISGSSTHYYSRVSNGLYSGIPFHLIERGYSADWESYRTINPKDRIAMLGKLTQ